MRLLPLWVCLLILAAPPAASTAASTAAERLITSLQPHIDHGGYALQIDDTTRYSANIDSTFIPASTIKILTGLMALEILGPQYRFSTHFFTDDEQNLYIQGEGDPFLVSEGVADIVDQLKTLGLKEINTLYLDGSAFALETPPAGSENSDNPYDADSSALAVNFNALPLQVLADGSIASGESQTPCLPMMKSIGRHYSRGAHRVNVSSFKQEKDLNNSLRYTGELFSVVFEEKGIPVRRGYAEARVPAQARRIFTYRSPKNVADLVRSILHYSNNFIANQLYLRCGSRMLKAPATWEKAALTLKEYIALQLRLDKRSIHVVDGSGLSKENRISPAAMLAILDKFRPYASLLKRDGDIMLKSGTLTGAYCYAGYFRQNHRLSPYVIFLNQQRNTRKTALQVLWQHFLASTSP